MVEKELLICLAGNPGVSFKCLLWIANMLFFGVLLFQVAKCNISSISSNAEQPCDAGFPSTINIKHHSCGFKSELNLQKWGGHWGLIYGYMLCLEVVALCFPQDCEILDQPVCWFRPTQNRWIPLDNSGELGKIMPVRSWFPWKIAGILPLTSSGTDFFLLLLIPAGVCLIPLGPVRWSSTEEGVVMQSIRKKL